MRIRRAKLLLIAIGVMIATGICIPAVRRSFHPFVLAIRGRQTVEERVAEFIAAKDRLASGFRDLRIAYPPARVVLVGYKDEKRLDVYASGADRGLRKVASHPILAASGKLGPKLKRGDYQVPEGTYAIDSVNPNSRFHVSLHVNYPNADDMNLASRQGRTDLGGDIMIHGGAASIGCIAVGDDAAEEIFVLVVESGLENVKVLLTPVDLRHRALPPEVDTETFGPRYEKLRLELDQLPG